VRSWIRYAATSVVLHGAARGAAAKAWVSRALKTKKHSRFQP